MMTIKNIVSTTRICGIVNLFLRSKCSHVFFKNINNYIDNNPLQNDIKNSLLNDMRGVKVLCTPEGTGKTTAIKKVCRDIYRDGCVSGTIYIKCTQNMLNFSNPRLWLSKYTGCQNIYKNLSYYINDSKKPLVLVFDDIDFEYTHPNFDILISSLAHDSVLSKKYVVLISTSHPYLARRILNLNCGSKIKAVGIPSLYKWGENTLLEKIENDKNLKKLNKDIETREKIIKCINTAGSPGFISEIFTYESFDDDILTKRSLDISVKWKESDLILSEYIIL